MWPLRVSLALIALLAAVPLLVVLSSLLTPDADVWAHLYQYILPGVLWNTALLLTGVLTGILLLGISLAWLVSQYQFPGRRLFAWALILPLAMPAYVLAFVQVGLLDFTGPLQTFLRNAFGADLRLPEIRSIGGAIWVLSLSFYPYVYLLARNAFDTLGQRALEVGQSLGLSPWQSLLHVALPLARPWIVAGTLLAMMETLADFGAVYVLGVDTFTTAIYKAWFAMFSLPAATQLASLLIVLALVLILLERWQRGMRRYQSSAVHPRRTVLTGARALLASGYAGLILAVAFVFPLIQLSVWVWRSGSADLDMRYIAFVWHSLALAGLAALLVLALAFVLGFGEHRLKNRFAALAVQIATLGYAIPGTVLAVGVFIPVTRINNWLIDTLQWSDSTLLEGSVLVLIAALACRFLSVGVSPLSSAFQRISPSLVFAARSLGDSSASLLRRLYLPLLRGGCITALLLVFIDVMKEMPITLMMRPFGWDTLAVRVFEMTAEGEWQRAALPATMLVLAGLLPVVLLIRSQDQARDGGTIHG